MKPRIIDLCPAQNMHHPFAQSILPARSQLVAGSIIRVTVEVSQPCVQVTLILLNNGLKAQE